MKAMTKDSIITNQTESVFCETIKQEIIKNFAKLKKLLTQLNDKRIKTLYKSTKFINEYIFPIFSNICTFSHEVNFSGIVVYKKIYTKRHDYNKKNIIARINDLISSTATIAFREKQKAKYVDYIDNYFTDFLIITKLLGISYNTLYLISEKKMKRNYEMSKEYYKKLQEEKKK
jgi:hypothetical protein